LNEDREFLLWRQRLRPQVADWQTHSGDSGYLLRGALLSEAERWLKGRRQDLDPAETSLIEQSVRFKVREALQRLRGRRRLTFAAFTAVAILLAATLVASLEWVNARHRAQLALSEQLAAQANLLVERPPFEVDLGTLLALES